DVPLRLGHPPLRSEDVPPAARSVAHVDRVSVEADAADCALGRPPADPDPSLPEAAAVTGEPTGDDDVWADEIVHAAQEITAVDRNAVREDEDRAQPVAG